ncbi:triose-phosphate isomerase family protein [Microbacterium sp. AK031]|uniref:triose-phosphate isomerase family protein n=1 Tax=Microbacterium sp. AK031 TaxID=2723076 RepID=UPI00216914C9|nr:triose-phosphate isomerase family protein [Microbacterium sp. AK031]MCS3842785.1 triosephosphate isomerase [Microbacterium sp. AK031]
MSDPAQENAARRPVLLGVSLKLYLDIDDSVAWAREIAGIAEAHPSVASGAVRVFVLPSLPAIAGVIDAIGDAPVAVGGQDLFWDDRGPYTGAVSGADLRRLGCRYVEVGHAERRQVFGEDAATIRRKFTAAVRNALTPVLCVGEMVEQAADAAAELCVDQLENALAAMGDESIDDLVVAYEPEWAIGRADPADAGHVASVTRRLREHLDGRTDIVSSSVIYGGSAKPGVISALDDAVDGLFLGRFAHDPDSFALILDEAAAVIR